MTRISIVKRSFEFAYLIFDTYLKVGFCLLVLNDFIDRI